MPRFSPLSPDSASGKTKTMFDAVKAKLGMVPNMMRTMGGAPAVLEAYLGFSGTLAHGELSAKIREQIALLSAQKTECEYCLSAHTVLGKGAGLTPADIASARRGESTDPKAAAALAFARRIMETNGSVSDDDVQRARAAGLSDAQIQETLANVVLNLFTNFFNHVAQTDIDFPKVSAA